MTKLSDFFGGKLKMTRTVSPYVLFVLLVALFAATTGLPIHDAQAAGTVWADWDFEDGVIPSGWYDWSAFNVEVPATIHTDPDGNDFLRITATPNDITDTGGISAIRVRSQTTVGGDSYEDGDSRTYRFSIRLDRNSAPVSDSVLMQLYQYDSTGAPSPYGAPDGTGPTVWIEGGTDGIHVRNYYDYERNFQQLDLGKIATDRWVNITVGVVWSLDPAKGRIHVWIDGELAGRLQGAPTILSPLSNFGSDMHIGTYGDGGVGVVDFDNIRIQSGVSSGSTNPPRRPSK
jgi:Polysaccharide lyase